MALSSVVLASHAVVEPIYIWNVKRGEEEWAAFCSSPSPDNFAQLDRVRASEEKFRSSFFTRFLTLPPGPADHWSWPEKYSAIKGRKPHLIGVIESPNGKGTRRHEGVQGAILLELSKSPHSGNDILEVKYIAAAPHNLKRSFYGVTVRAKFSVGYALMKIATKESHACGFGGRLGLYALPKAEMFYEKIGLTKFDHLYDPEGLVYFEGLCSF